MYSQAKYNDIYTILKYTTNIYGEMYRFFFTSFFFDNMTTTF